ncbi:hypothetical protein ACMFMG_001534 [Clarireedia jacksonii]
MFDIIVTSTTVQELEVDPAAVDFVHPESPPDFGEKQKRTFHQYKEGNHQLELQRVLFDGKIFLAPLDPDQKKEYHVLDIGTGTGKWAIEFAMEHPNAKVIGTDLSLMNYESLPDNCEFIVADAEDPWEFSHKFDFIHLNDLFMCFEDQKEIFRRSFDALAPGGYTQILDPMLPLKSIDNTLENTSLEKWFKACVKAGEVAGRPWLNVTYYKEWMEDIGFEEVTEVVYHIPINDWPLGSKEKEVGMMLRQDLSISLSSLKSILTHSLKWKEADTDELLNGAKYDLRNRNIHAYLPLYIIWGRKPRK